MNIGCFAIGPRYNHDGLCRVFVETQYPHSENEEHEGRGGAGVLREVIPLSEAVNNNKKTGRPKTKYLPGERLLKKINQQHTKKVKKKLSINDIERINKSFENLMNEF